IEIAKSFYDKNQKYLNIGIFLFGFFFDIFTLDGVDSVFSVGQQAIYLGLLAIFLSFEIKESIFSFVVSEKWQRIWKYKTLAIHFLLGSLLSIYTIFFFKSASVWNSFLFLSIVLGL